MREYCFRSNETKDKINTVIAGLSEDQKITLFDLRLSTKADLGDCRRALESNEWSMAKAYTQMNRAGKLFSV